jgi:hypothetical protein
MVGLLLFGGVTPDETVSTVATTGQPGFIELALTGNAAFAAVASFAYVDTQCPGSFTASLTGTMTFQT